MRTLFPAADMPDLPPFTRRWMTGDSGATPFLPPPRRRSSGASPLAAGARRPWEPLLSAVSRRNRELGNPLAEPLVTKLREGAVAVVAGQQVGLLGGPLLTLYKALEAIRIASVIEAAGTPAVPVFWMATEDHDLAEVLDVRLPTPGGPARFPVPPEAAANRKPVGALAIGEGPAELLRVHGLEPPADLGPALDPGRTFAESFARHLVVALAGRPILLFDPSIPEAKWNLSDLFARLFREGERFGALLSAREAELRGAGFELQVVHRPGQRHLFLLDLDERRPLDLFDDGRIGPRDGDPSERRPVEEWARLAEEHPDRLSPAVLVRPLAASRLLPQAVAVLGPSEVAYWAQSMPLFPMFDLPVPDLAPRPHLFLLDATARRLLDRLGVSVADVLAGSDELLRRLAQREIGGPLARFREASIGLRHHLASLEEPLAAIDPTLRGAFSRAAEKIDQQVDLLVRKGEEAAARQDGTRTKQAERLAAMLCPGGIPQERHDALLPWLIRYPDLSDAVASALAGAGEGAVVAVDVGRSGSDPEEGS